MNRRAHRAGTRGAVSAASSLLLLLSFGCAKVERVTPGNTTGGGVDAAPRDATATADTGTSDRAAGAISDRALMPEIGVAPDGAMGTPQAAKAAASCDAGLPMCNTGIPSSAAADSNEARIARSTVPTAARAFGPGLIAEDLTESLPLVLRQLAEAWEA